MQERFNDISIVRCGAMLMVVFYHCICAYGIWDNPAYSVSFHIPAWNIAFDIMRNIHMPIFFLLAGYLFGYKRSIGEYDGFWQFVKRKFSRVMIPYFLVGLIIVAVQHEPIASFRSGISHLWFLMSIFECYIAGRIIDRILRISSSLKLLLLAVCFLIIAFEDTIGLTKHSLTYQYCPYYVIGMLLGSLNLYRPKMLPPMLASTISSFILLAISACYIKNDDLLRTLGLIFVVSLFLLMRNHPKIKISATTKSLDRCSMGIYIVHHILIQEMNSICYFHCLMKVHPTAYPIIQFTFVVAISWCIVLILKRYDWGKYLVG